MPKSPDSKKFNRRRYNTNTDRTTECTTTEYTENDDIPYGHMHI